ncbi:hypothetical protein JW905_09485, partial [bacterium]|nr:hypothetical protein [candidate division CSSED10-310 bacterium]
PIGSESREPVPADPLWLYKAGSETWARQRLKELGCDTGQVVGCVFHNLFQPRIFGDPYQWGKGLLRGNGVRLGRMNEPPLADRSHAARMEEFQMMCGRILDYLAMEHGVRVVVFSADGLDAEGCRRLAAGMRSPPVVVDCREYRGRQFAALLGGLRMLITMNASAAVLALKEAVPTVMVSDDDQLIRLAAELGIDRWRLSPGDADFEARLEGLAAELLAGNRRRNEVRAVLRERLPGMYGGVGMLALRLRRMVVSGFGGFALREVDEGRLLDLVPGVPWSMSDRAQRCFEGLARAASPESPQHLVAH